MADLNVPLINEHITKAVVLSSFAKDDIANDAEQINKNTNITLFAKHGDLNVVEEINKETDVKRFSRGQVLRSSDNIQRAIDIVLEQHNKETTQQVENISSFVTIDHLLIGEAETVQDATSIEKQTHIQVRFQEAVRPTTDRIFAHVGVDFEILYVRLTIDKSFNIVVKRDWSSIYYNTHLMDAYYKTNNTPPNYESVVGIYNNKVLWGSFIMKILEPSITESIETNTNILLQKGSNIRGTDNLFSYVGVSDLKVYNNVIDSITESILKIVGSEVRSKNENLNFTEYINTNTAQTNNELLFVKDEEIFKDERITRRFSEQDSRIAFALDTTITGVEEIKSVALVDYIYGNDHAFGRIENIYREQDIKINYEGRVLYNNDRISDNVVITIPPIEDKTVIDTLSEDINKVIQTIYLEGKNLNVSLTEQVDTEIQSLIEVGFILTTTEEINKTVYLTEPSVYDYGAITEDALVKNTGLLIIISKMSNVEVTSENIYKHFDLDIFHSGRVPEPITEQVNKVFDMLFYVHDFDVLQVDTLVQDMDAHIAFGQMHSIIYSDVIENNFNIVYHYKHVDLTQTENILKDVNSVVQLGTTVYSSDTITYTKAAEIFVKDSIATRQDNIYNAFYIDTQLGNIIEHTEILSFESMFTYYYKDSTVDSTDVITSLGVIDYVYGNDHAFMRSETLHTNFVIEDNQLVIYNGKALAGVSDTLSNTNQMVFSYIEKNIQAIVNQISHTFNMSFAIGEMKVASAHTESIHNLFNLSLDYNGKIFYPNVLDNLNTSMHTVLKQKNSSTPVETQHILNLFDFKMERSLPVLNTTETINNLFDLYSIIPSSNLSTTSTESLLKLFDLDIVKTLPTESVVVTLNKLFSLTNIVPSKNANVSSTTNMILSSFAFDITYNGKVFYKQDSINKDHNSNVIKRDYTITKTDTLSKTHNMVFVWKYLILTDNQVDTINYVTNFIPPQSINKTIDTTDMITNSFVLDYVYGNDHAFMRDENLNKNFNTIVLHTGRVFNPTANITKTATTTLTNTVPITITLNKQSGSGGTNSITSIYNKSISPTSITPPTRTNYTFQGYYTSTNGGGTKRINANGTYAALTNTTYQSAVTLYAHWTVNNLYFDWNPDPSTIGMRATVSYGPNTSSWTDELNMADWHQQKPANHWFKISNVAIPPGWAYASNATSRLTSLFTAVPSVGSTDGSTINIHGQGDISSTLGRAIAVTVSGLTYNITVGQNGGSGSSANKSTYVVGTASQTVTMTPGSRAGYNFSHWAVSGANGKATVSGNTITLPAYTSSNQVYGNLTITAQWTPAVFNITLNPNTGTGPADNTISVTYNTSIDSWTANHKPTKTNWVFNGYWTATSGGLQRINAAGTYVNLNSNTYSSAATLYAQWIDNNLSATTSTDTIGKTTNVVITNTVPITITLNKQSGSGGTSSITSVYNKYLNPTSTISVPSRTGYTFGGYYTGTGGSGTQRINASGAYINLTNTTYSSNTTLYARWTPIVYSISRTLGPGISAATITPSTYTIETPTFTPVISGVTYQSGYNGYSVSPTLASIPQGSTGNRSYTITGTAINYTVSINANGGSPSGSLGTYTKSVFAQSKHFENPVKTGHTLTGYTITGHTGTIPYVETYDISTKVLIIPPNTTGNLTVTFNWSVNSYTLTKGSIPTGVATFVVTRTSSPNQGAGTGALNNGATIYYGDTLTTSATAANGYNTPTRNWSSRTVTGDTSATVTAGSRILYTLTVDNNGGSGASNGTHYVNTSSTLATLLGTPTRTGYNFLGWKPTTSAGGWNAATTYASNFNVSGKYANVTMVAQWDFAYNVRMRFDGGAWMDFTATQITVQADFGFGYVGVTHPPNFNAFTFFNTFEIQGPSPLSYDLLDMGNNILYSGSLTGTNTFSLNGSYIHTPLPGNPPLYPGDMWVKFNL